MSAPTDVTGGRPRAPSRRSPVAGACSCGPAAPSRSIRVMVEAPTDEEADSICTKLADLVQRELA